MQRSAEPNATGVTTVDPLVARHRADPGQPGFRGLFRATVSRWLRNLYFESESCVEAEDVSQLVEKETQGRKQQGGDPSGPAQPRTHATHN